MIPERSARFDRDTFEKRNSPQATQKDFRKRVSANFELGGGSAAGEDGAISSARKRGALVFDISARRA